MKEVIFLMTCCLVLCACGNNGSAVSDKDLKLPSETTKNSSEAMQTVEGTAQAEKDVENETEEIKKEVGTASDNAASVIASSTASKIIEPNNGTKSKEEKSTENKDDKKSKDKPAKKDKISKTEPVVKNIGTPGFSFQKGGSYIYINQPFTAYKALGKEDNFFSAPSCAFQGKTNIYEYKDYTVSVVEEPKKEGLVFSVLLTDESVMTSEGVKIGDDVQKMKKVYGKPVDTTDASFVYRKGDVELIFIHEDDEITSIEYRSTILEKENE